MWAAPLCVPVKILVQARRRKAWQIAVSYTDVKPKQSVSNDSASDRVSGLELLVLKQPTFEESRQWIPQRLKREPKSRIPNVACGLVCCINAFAGWIQYRQSNCELYHDLVAIHGTEGISPHRHFPSAMVSNEVVTLNDAGYNFRRKLATVLSAQLGEVSRMLFETRRGGAVSLGIRAMTNGAKAAKHLLPCLPLGHPLGRVRGLRLFLRECRQTASQNKYQHRQDPILTSHEILP